jgi:S-(hydroxymethyl)glutathione dehydrogenase/alcohol dehydrogenase
MTGVGAVTNTAQVRPGSSVAIFGAGGIGLNAIQGSSLSGATKIIAVDTNPLKLDFAKKFGATHFINAADADPVEAIRELTGGRGADYTFEAIGNAKVMRQAYDSARRGGTIVIIGLTNSDAQLELPAQLIPREEKKLLGSFYGSARQRVDMPRLIDLYRTGHLKLDELVTRTYPIDEVQQAFDDMEAGKNARGVLVF